MNEPSQQPYTAPPPLAQPATRPDVEITTDLASWSVGQPMKAGTGEPLYKFTHQGLNRIARAVGLEGLLTFTAIVHSATPTSDGQGNINLELPGYSGAWVMDNVGLSRTLAYRASNALQDAGLIVVANNVGARGSEGGQRAIVNRHLIGLPGGLEGVAPTRRGRGKGGSVSRNAAKGASDGSIGLQNTGKATAFSQVGAYFNNPANGPLGVEEDSGSTTSLSPSNTADLAALGAENIMGVLSANHLTWDDLRRALAAAHDSASLAEVLRVIVNDYAAQAGALAKHLSLPGENIPVALKVATYIAEICLSVDDANGPVWQRLADGGVNMRATGLDADTMAPRLVASIAAGLASTKVIGSWAGFLFNGITGKTPYASNSAVRRLGKALDAAVDRSPEVSGTPAPSMEPDSGALMGSTNVPDPNRPLDDLELVDLYEAVKWGEPNEHFWATKGMNFLMSRPPIARSLLSDWRSATG